MWCWSHVLVLLALLATVADLTQAGDLAAFRDLLLTSSDLDDIQSLTAPSQLTETSGAASKGSSTSAGLLAEVGDLATVDDQSSANDRTLFGRHGKTSSRAKLAELANIGGLTKMEDTDGGNLAQASDLADVNDLTISVKNLTMGRAGRKVGGSGRALPEGLVQRGSPYETWSSYNQRVEGDRSRRLARQKRSAGRAHSRQKRFLSFPTGSILYLEPNVYLPVYRSRQLFQYIYAQYTMGWIIPSTLVVGRSAVDLARIYDTAESTISRFGMDGKACLLRAICEVAAYPMEHEGLFGEIMNIVLSASRGSEGDAQLHPYIAAEYQGRAQGDCHATYSDCPVSMFNLL